MPSVGVIKSYYSACELERYDANSFTLGFTLTDIMHFADLKTAIEACASQHKTASSAHVKANFQQSWTNGSVSGFEVKFEAAPMTSPLGALHRPFQPSEMFMFAQALKREGCISDAAMMRVSSAVGALQHRTFRRP